MTKRVLYQLIYALVMISSVVLGIATLFYYKEYGYNFLYKLSFFLIVVGIVLFAGCCLFVKLTAGTLKNYIAIQLMYNGIENNLIRINAVYDCDKDSIVKLTPKVKIDTKNSKIVIYIDDLKIRKALEQYKDVLDTCLPDRYIIDDRYIDNTGNKFIMLYHDEQQEVQKEYNMAEFKTLSEKLGGEKFMVDDKHIITLSDRPHWLICGGTGSGKSYLAQELLLQFIYKGYEIAIYDIKKTYKSYENIVQKYITEPKDIYNDIASSVNEMISRQNQMEDILKFNPNATTRDLNLPTKIIIIEEYIGLINLLEAKERKEFEANIKKLSVLARSADIHLFIVSQSADVSIIDSAIKNNVNKIFMGYLAPNISVSTFGQGVDVPLFNEYSKGFGYIQLDRVEQIKVPKLAIHADDLLSLEAIFLAKRHQASEPEPENVMPLNLS